MISAIMSWRHAEQSPLKLFLWTAICLALMLGLAWLALSETLTRHRLAASGTRAEAIVVGIHESRGRRSSRYSPIVLVQTPSGEPLRLRVHTERQASEFFRGQKIAVIYGAGPGHVARFEQEMSAPQGPMPYVFGFGALLCLFGAGMGGVRLFRATA